jgi:Ser/Thr protein kinase RdoA (MazF antagonist)
MDENYYIDIARQALTVYGMDDLPCVFLQHSENVTFRVDRPDGTACLLRLHIPFNPALGKHGADAKVVNSEMLWLRALNRDTHLPVPYPLENKQGEFVTQIAAEDGGPINCTLLQWLEGGAYERKMENEDTAAQIGVLIGTLHLHSSHWRLPHGFTRPVRDVAYFHSAIAALRPAVDDGRISYKDYKSLEISIETLTTMMQAVRKTRQTEGLLHGDLHRGNLIIHNGQIKLIDFSLCSFGNFMFDLGVCLSDINPDLRSIFLINYDRLFHLQVEYERLIEGFFLGSFIGTFAFLITNPLTQETLVHKVPVIAREYAERFNRDERFWFKST